MQSNIFPFVAFDLNRNFRLCLPFRSLDVGSNDVVLFAGGYPLGELTSAVRNQFPLRLFVGSTANRNRNAGGGAVICTPHRAIDQGVILDRRVLRRRFLGTADGNRAGDEPCPGNGEREERDRGFAMRSTAHPTPLPLRRPFPRLRRLPPPPPGSTPGDRPQRPQSLCHTPGRRRLLPRLPRLLRCRDRFRTRDKSPWPVPPIYMQHIRHHGSRRSCPFIFRISCYQRQVTDT